VVHVVEAEISQSTQVNIICRTEENRKKKTKQEKKKKANVRFWLT
jgi:hypothetical protein